VKSEKLGIAMPITTMNLEMLFLHPYRALKTLTIHKQRRKIQIETHLGKAKINQTNSRAPKIVMQQAYQAETKPS
jgi:hypothetical protein